MKNRELGAAPKVCCGHKSGWKVGRRRILQIHYFVAGKTRENEQNGSIGAGSRREKVLEDL